MPRFNIYDPARAIDLGTYEAETGAAALDLMVQGAGYRDAAHMRKVTGTDPDLIVTPVGLLPLTEPAAFRARREAAKLSQSRAAAMIGVSLRTLQHWEAGEYKIDPEKAQRFVERTARLIK